MSTDLPELDYTQLGPTRAYLQDVSRVIGKAQQTFVPADPHDWQRGLEVAQGTIATKTLPRGGQIVLDLQVGVARAGSKSWNLGEISAPDLMADLEVWLAEQEITKRPEQPDYVSSHPVYDKQQSQAMAAALSWAAEAFANFKQNIIGGLVSPVLLYPHHFDLSLVWFPFGDTTQIGFGFSFGDEYIAEPYFYVTAWPEPAEFGGIALAKPAIWHTKGFHGAVLRYQDLIKQPNARQTLTGFCQNMLNSTQPMLKPST